MGGRAKRRCAYCSRDATTQDHVLARCFLEKPYPRNLPTLPSCQQCNRKFQVGRGVLPSHHGPVGVAVECYATVDAGR